jgi:hypothetical protein
VALARIAALADDDAATLERVCEVIDAVRDAERHAARTVEAETVRELIAASDDYIAAPHLQATHRLAAARRRALDAIGDGR